VCVKAVEVISRPLSSSHRHDTSFLLNSDVRGSKLKHEGKLWQIKLISGQCWNDTCVYTTVFVSLFQPGQGPNGEWLDDWEAILVWGFGLSLSPSLFTIQPTSCWGGGRRRTEREEIKRAAQVWRVFWTRASPSLAPEKLRSSTANQSRAIDT
jgi:hypothetical protein